METDWLWGLGGGFLIGLAGAMFPLVNGRVMGASGIFGGLIDGTGRDTWTERLAFLAGLVVIPVGLVPVLSPETHLTENLPVILAAGLMVGFGTRLANGCTSGHGVCGISRLSLRGLAATAIYILAGGLVMVSARHFWGLI
ncbi:MAG: YeeE/YedE family protein [Tabrizicola sp.]|nr:YeeE/YedE family protein [Tabrizicola sp.]